MGPRTSAVTTWPQWFAGLHAAGSAFRQSRDADLAQRMVRARAFIDDHFDHSVDLDGIARQAHFSRYHFHRLFRNHYGVTPHEYLTQIRLRKARKLLAETDLSITQVCFEVGFQSLGSFSTLFNRHIGHSPSRYRRTVVQSAWERPVAVPWCFLSSCGATGPTLTL